MSKLVRDKIPQIIRKNENRTPKIHTASPSEYREKLYEKLSEEVAELIKDKNPDEMADILEVVRAIIKLNRWTYPKIEKLRVEKARKRGKFNRQIILDS